MSHVRPGPSLVLLTSAGDGTAHLVAQNLYEACLVEGAGRIAVACGRVVLAASMATEPRRQCPLCRASVTSAKAR